MGVNDADIDEFSGDGEFIEEHPVNAGAFLWKGSANPPLVQRMMAWFMGLFLVGFGLLGFVFATESSKEIGVSYFLFFIPILPTLLGIRVFRNGFPRRTKPTNVG